MLFLKQSTAVTVKIGPFLDSTDGNTAETSLTLSQADIRLSKNGANIAQKNESSSASHDELGYYDCDLDTTDTGTLGRLQLFVHESGALPIWHEFMVVPANVYDSLVGGSDMLEVDVQAVDGDETAAANLELDYDGTGYAKANSTVGTVTTLTGHTPQTGDSFARLGAPAGASIAADIAAVEDQTDDIGAAGAGLTAVPWNAAWDAEVQSEVQDAIEANHLDHLLATTYDPAGKPGAADALLNEIIENDGGVSRFTVNSLENAPSGTGASAESIRIEMDANSTQLAAIVEDTAEIGAAGAGLSAVPWNASWDAEVQSEVQDAIEANHLDHLLAADYDPSSKPGTATALLNELVENDGGVSRFTQNALEEAPGGSDGSGFTAIPWNASWDAEVQSEVTDALNAYDPPTKAELDSGFAALNDPTVGAIADAICDEALSGHSTPGTVGKQLTDVALTDELPSSPPSAASIRAEIDSNSTQLAAIVADTGALNNTALPDSVPADGSLPTLKQAMYMITQFLTERSVSGTTLTVKKVNGSTSLMTFTLDDGTSPTSITRAT